MSGIKTLATMAKRDFFESLWQMLHQLLTTLQKFAEQRLPT